MRDCIVIYEGYVLRLSGFDGNITRVIRDEAIGI